MVAIYAIGDKQHQGVQHIALLIFENFRQSVSHIPPNTHNTTPTNNIAVYPLYTDCRLFSLKKLACLNQIFKLVYKNIKNTV